MGNKKIKMIAMCYFILPGIVSGALLQLAEQFDLSCMEQAVIVSSMLAGAIVGSLLGGK